MKSREGLNKKYNFHTYLQYLPTFYDSVLKIYIFLGLPLGKPSKKINRIFHDIVQNSFATYPPYLIMT